MQSVDINNNNNNNNSSDLMDDEREYLRTQRDLLNREQKQFENEKIAFEQNLKKVESFHSSDPIELNIGGKKFCTTLETLTKYRDSFFGAMFSGYIALKPMKDGSYFIDRDGTNFHYILNFLRTGELIVPQNKPHLLKMLLLEAEFYQIEELTIQLGGHTHLNKLYWNELFLESTILPPSQPQFGEQLNEWAGCENHQKWKLIYKGSKDGFQGEIFHKQCDNRGTTYTIAKSGDSIFGGYNPNSWQSPESTGIWVNGKDSFLFSLVNIYNIAPTKLDWCNPIYGPYNRKDLLPTFGGGYDLYFSNNCNMNENSYSYNQSNYYKNPTDKGKDLFTGKQKFKVDEIEVFAKM